MELGDSCRQMTLEGDMSHRKRVASGQKTPTLECEPGNIPIAKGVSGSPDRVPETVPVEVLDTIFEFLDGNGLLSCETVSYRWRLATDRTSLWEAACLSAFPHLGDGNCKSANASCSAYEGDWREAFLDGNRGNRSVVLDWDMEAVGEGAGAGAAADGGDPEESDRKYFPPFSLCGYSFSLLADPGGNPRAANQALAVGAARVEKGLSVYLTVAFQDDLPDTPPWGGGESAFDQPFPPPPLQFGPGHPWGANRMELDSDSDNDETDSQESERDLESGRGIDRLSSASFARIVNSNATLVPAKKHSGAGRASPEMVRRDPHGLRRRRRRCRRREGRIKGVSHDGDPATVARECCASFSLAAMNKTGRRDFMWASSMEGDRFYPGRNSWGVHCLLPTSVIQDPDEGFLKDGALTVRLRLRVLFLTAHVYTTADLASHRGFGVVPVRGKEKAFHYLGPRGSGCADFTNGVDNAQGTRGGPNSSGVPDTRYPSVPTEHSCHDESAREESYGPLSCLTFEVLRCTTLEEMEKMVATALGVTWPRDIRLWVITQPTTDCPLAPRQLLSGEDVPSRFTDDGQTSPSLCRLLSGDMVDDTCRVRLWVEQRADGGYWETERSHRCWPVSTSPTEDQPPEVLLTPESAFAGVRLASTARMPPWHMQAPLEWGSTGGADAWLADAVMGQHLSNVMATPAPADNRAASAAADAPDEASPAQEALTSSASVSIVSPAKPSKEVRILVFIKTLGLGGKDGRKSGQEPRGDTNATNSECGPAYLTHAVLRGRSPLRSLFELTAHALDDGTRPEELGAYLEDLPCAWQDGVEEKSAAACTPARTCGDANGQTSAGFPIHPRRKKGQPCKRFFTCPSPLISAATSGEAAEEYRAKPRANHDAIRVATIGTPGAGDVNRMANTSGSSSSSSIDATTNDWTTGREETAGDHSATSSLSQRSTGSSSSGAFPPHGKARREEDAHEGVPQRKGVLTLAEAGVLSGASICFYRRASCNGEGGEAITRRTYAAATHELIESMRLLLRGEGPLGRVHLIKLPEVVEACESMGYQGFRARIAHAQQRHVNARETLEYVAKGRHLAFICDSCGTQDFCGPRYHCLRCPNYDLCKKCYNKLEPVPRHRYLFTEGHWKREGGYDGHAEDHELEEIVTVPADGLHWRNHAGQH